MMESKDILYRLEFPRCVGVSFHVALKINSTIYQEEYFPPYFYGYLAVTIVVCLAHLESQTSWEKKNSPRGRAKSTLMHMEEMNPSLSCFCFSLQKKKILYKWGSSAEDLLVIVIS